MKRYTVTLFLGLFFLQASAQYYSIPVRHDTAFQWAAECDKIINLTPKASEHSLKKWYLGKLRNSSVAAYKRNAESNSVSSYTLSMPELKTQDWLKGFSIELSPHKHPQEWYFFDTTMPADDYNRYKARVRNLNVAAAPCCGCDDADAFRSKQILNYKNGKFNIHNLFISPLCARQTEKPPADWYPLCNVAYNGNTERKFPGLSNDVVLLNTNEIDYDFNREKPSLFDSVLTVYKTDIGSLIYQDILKGKLKAVDTETGKMIPVKKILTIGMPADTVAVYDINDPSKIVEYRVLQQERSSSDFNRIRIKQDLYFDFKNERLYSVILSVTVMQVFKSYDGTIRGQSPFCRLE
ncbi:MAG: hypothetical protein HOP10_00880 [Chitinophagaceae bacterium]|nr:hypothetical protein [Chitinophagaceae bacterium]